MLNRLLLNSWLVVYPSSALTPVLERVVQQDEGRRKRQRLFAVKLSLQTLI